MNNREREALERMGDDLAALVFEGKAVVDEPWRMPLPRQEAFVTIVNEARSRGEPVDMVSIHDWCRSRGQEFWQLQYTLSNFATLVHLRICYPTPESIERLKARVMEGSEQVRVALLFESGAEEVRRGRFPTKQLEMLRKGGRDGA